MFLTPVVAWLFEQVWRSLFEFSGGRHFSISLFPDHLLVLVLADIFRIGVQLREEQEVTV